MGLRTERVQLLMEPGLIEAVEDFQFAQRIKTRAEAIRQLLWKGVAEQQESKKAEALCRA